MTNFSEEQNHEFLQNLVNEQIYCGKLHRKYWQYYSDDVVFKGQCSGKLANLFGIFAENEIEQDPFALVCKQELREKMLEAVKTLRPKLAKVLILRFGLGGGSEHTLEQVGTIFGVTRERIRQMEARAMRDLRHPSRSRPLKGFLLF